MFRKMAAASGLVVLMTGCATNTAPAEPTSEPNADACVEFGDATMTVGDAVTTDTLGDLDIPAKFDEALLVADGDVKERLQRLIDELPDPPHMVIWMDNASAYSENVEAVARACDAADLEMGPVALLEQTGGPFPTVTRR